MPTSSYSTAILSRISRIPVKLQPSFGQWLWLLVNLDMKGVVGELRLGGLHITLREGDTPLWNHPSRDLA
jgi:hypothetical protein